MQIDPFRPFRPWLGAYRRQVLLGLVLLFIALSIQTVMPLLLRQAIDLAQGVAEPMFGWSGSFTGNIPGDMSAYAAVIGVLALIAWAVNFGMRWYFTLVSRYVERDLRHAYVHHLLRLPLRFFHQRRVGDLMARTTNDVEAIQRFLHHAFRMTLSGILTFVLSLAVMCSIDWQLALLSLAPMPVMVLATNAVSGRIRDGYRRVQEQFGAISTRIQENLSGVRVVKACAIESRQIEEFSDLNEEYVERNRRLVFVRSLFYPFTALLNGASMVVVLWLGGLRLIDDTLTLGSFVAFNAYLIRMSRPMYLLGRMVDEFQRAVASLGRIDAVLQQPPEDRGGDEASPVGGEIELRHVSFAYDGGEPVLDDISLHVPAGSTLALVGRVGAGKTTLARLVPRLLEPTAGEVLVDGVPVDRLPLAALRGSIGYVPQDSFLFSDTIRENILLGGGADGDGDPVLAAADVSQLTADLDGFPAGFETVVGERGVTLSGGQKQRTALARAVIREPRILILDDALASVDTDTEERILDGLRVIMRSRTTIVIAHRLSTVRHADQIVVLDGGGIAEQGTHDELVARDGLYADMYRRQSLARELTEL
jgi:ATP-binding cassette subfamily B protein